MLICNTCGKTEEDIKITIKTMICVGCYDKEYQKKNKEKLKERKKKYYEDNKESIKDSKKEYLKEYLKKNKEKLKEDKKKYYKDNKEKLKEDKKIYYENNKEYIKIKNSKYREDNNESIKEYRKEYYENNKEKIKIINNEYRINNKDKINKQQKERLNDDNLYRLSLYTRNMINKAFNSINSKKNSKTSKILGCSFEEFKLHLESKFEDWMTWENYGKYNGELNYGWDIDHKIPLSSAVTEEDIYRLNHFTNLQPLCSYNNRYIKKDNF